MAVRNEIAGTLTDKTAAKPKPPVVTIDHGSVRVATHSVAVTNGDSVTTTFVMARVPPTARLLRESLLVSGGVAGLTDVDFGTPDDPDCLVNGADLSATGDDPAASEISIGTLGKAVWEVAGLTKAPADEIELIVTLNAAATADGTIAVDLRYVSD